MTRTQFGLALGVNGLGWDPAAGGGAGAADPAFWSRTAIAAEAAGFDVLTFEDAPALAAGSGQPARLDSFSLASWLAPQTSRIGLVPAGTTALQEPFHVATATQTLDFASLGRAGLRLRIGLAEEEFAAYGKEGFGRIEEINALPEAERDAVLRRPFDEALEFAQIVRLLWDSWQDDAEIRDVATGRFLDADRIHNPEFRGRFLSVHGASITPRSPQGQPPVFALAHQRIPYEFAAATADVVFITPFDDADLDARRAEALAAIDRTGRTGQPLQLWADIAVSLTGDRGAAAPTALDTGVYASSAAELVDRILAWRERGIEGIRLRPLDTERDLERLAEEVLPALREAGAAPASETGTLRDRLGLPEAANRFTGEAPFTAAFNAPEEARA